MARDLSTRARARGFTLIELVMVIVILGILSAVALPRFSDLTGNARAATAQGLAAAVSGGMASAHASALVNGYTAASGQSISMEGNTVNLVYGYPAATVATGIANAVSTPATQATASYGTPVATTTPNTLTWTIAGATTAASCKVVYTEATSASVPATVAATTTGC